MSYNSIQFFAIFVPALIVIYQICAQKYRWIVLLLASYMFFIYSSGALLIYNFITVIITYVAADILTKISSKKAADKQEKKLKNKRKKQILALGIVLNFLILLVLKYTNFLGSNIFALINKFGASVEYKKISFLVPIGISYYTMQAVSYLIDVYRGTVSKEKNIFKLSLYLSFFPTILEGPIARYSDISSTMFAGNAITYENITAGYRRILWGLFQKVVLADHMAIGVEKIFDSGNVYDGSVILYGAILCTLQLYMDFAGTIDIIIGTAKIFGITLPENFRQPFFAKNAGDFWHRWHITLGTWFKDYIFYPISFAKPMAKASKKIKKVFGMGVSRMFTPTIALFCVWISNGLWHGPKGTYIFYGIYYFILIFIENILEKPISKKAEELNIDMNSFVIRAVRFVKLFIIVIIGEMLFRADTLKLGFSMLKSIFTNFHISAFVSVLADLVYEPYDYAIMFIGMIIVIVVSVLREKNISLSSKIGSLPKAVRWVIWYAAIFTVIIFGAYGPGFDAIAMMYAAF